MAAFYILAVDDREYKLKLTTASKIEAEKRLGFSLLEAPENITRAETFAVILWAALQKYHRTMTLPKVYDLIDEMEDNGCTISEKADLLLEVMKVSGFFRRRICKRWKRSRRRNNLPNCNGTDRNPVSASAGCRAFPR